MCETRFLFKFTFSAILLWESSCVKEKITRRIAPSDTLGNSPKKLLARRLLLFLHPEHLLRRSRTQPNQNRADKIYLFETEGAIHSTKIPTGPPREKRTTSKGGPVFSKLFRLDRTDPLSFGPKFPEILVEWIAPRYTVCNKL